MQKHALITSLCICVLMLTTVTLAEKAQRGIYNYNSFGAGYNPLGVLLDNRLYMRLPLSTKPGVLWESTKLDIGLQSSWTPADEIVGLRVTLEPIAFFSLTATAGFYGMYNIFGYGLYPFSSGNEHYGPGLPKNADPQSAAGAWYSLSPELKLKAGHLIFVNTVTVDYVSLNRAGYYLELRNFTLRKTRDTDLMNNANLLFEFNKNLLAGCVYHYLSVFGTDIESHRISALAIRLFPDTKLGSVFTAVTAGYYPSDPAFNRTFYLGAMAGMDLRLRGLRYINGKQNVK
jgi:hypothetical protein